MIQFLYENKQVENDCERKNTITFNMSENFQANIFVIQYKLLKFAKVITMANVL